MGNLTQEEKVVSDERSGYAPKPGHDIVIFELIDQGLRNGFVAPEAKPFEPKKTWLFGKGIEYASYAVRNDKHLRHTFTNRFTHMSVAHTFDLTFTLKFCVGDAQLVVEKLQSDPLRAVRDEVQERVGGLVAALSWEDIVKSKLSNNSTSLSQKVAQGQILADLNTFSRAYGLELAEIGLALNLTSEDTEPLIAKAKLHRSTEVAQIEQIRESGQIKRELELGVERQQLAEQKQIHENEIALLKQRAAVQGGALDAVKQAFINIGSDTRTPEALYRGVELLGRTFDPSGGPAGSGAGRRGLASGTPSPNALLSAGTGEEEGLEGLMKEALGLFGGNNGDKQLLVDILHWIIENYLGKAADPAQLTLFKKRLGLSMTAGVEAGGEKYFFLERVLNQKELNRLLAQADR